MPGKKFLVISEIGIGDALTLIPALRLLRQARPEVEIDMIAPGLLPLAGNVAEVATILDHSTLPFGNTGERMDWLIRQNYEWVWNTENEKSPWRPVLAAAGRSGWISAPAHRDWPVKPVLALRSAQLRKLFPSLRGVPQVSLPLLERQRQRRDEFRAQCGQFRRLVAIQPGANDATKQWAPEKFCALARKLAETPQTGVLFFLGPQDAETFPPAVLPPGPALRRVQQPLAEVLPLLAACDAFIGNDSGFYHLAYALGMRVIGIYRSRRNRRVWAYRDERSRALCIYLPSQIRRHWRRFISVERVLREFDDLMCSSEPAATSR